MYFFLTPSKIHWIFWESFRVDGIVKSAQHALQLRRTQKTRCGGL
jgi:hypothetical protein